MANIADYTDFVGELNIPQASSPEGQSAINRFIDIYEPEFLKRVLGYDLWKAFTDGLLEVTPAQKWLDLRNGKEFVSLSGYNKKWEGFKNVQRQSPNANYVYWHWMENEVTTTTGTGEKVASNQNAINATATYKMTRAWNRMVDMVYILKEFLDVNAETYPEFVDFIYPFRYFKKQNLFSI